MSEVGGNGSVALDYAGEPRHWDPRFGYLFIDYPGYGLCEWHPNPSRMEENIVQLTRMDQVLDVRGSRKDAVDSFKHKPPSAGGSSPSWVSRFFGGK